MEFRELLADIDAGMARVSAALEELGQLRARVIRALKDTGMTEAQLAKELGVSQPRIHQLLKKGSDGRISQ